MSDAIFNAFDGSPDFQVVRDKESLTTGDSIQSFEQNIGWANHIAVIYSEKS